MRNLDKYHIILASKSPRRQELLKGMGLCFDTMTACTDETYPDNIEAYQIPEYLSQQKMKSVSRLPLPENHLIIAADTLVFVNEKPIGKPRNREQAVDMLKTLSDNTHVVVTGVCVATKEKNISFSSLSHVKFAHLDMDDIEYYIDNYKPYDKAGAYGIQEWIGYIGITGIDGSFYNVMGLPTQKLFETLKQF